MRCLLFVGLVAGHGFLKNMEKGNKGMQKYDGHIYELSCNKHDGHSKYMKYMKKNGASLFDEDMFMVGRDLDMSEHIEKAKSDYGCNAALVDTDPQKHIDDHHREVTTHRATLAENGNKKFGTTYHTLSEIEAHMDNLAKAHKGVHVKTVGTTFENRDIKMLVIDKGGNKNKKGKNIVLECGVHAREWLSPASCLDTVDDLLKNEDNDMLKDYAYHVMPVGNPDGYAYTWDKNGDRLWRKNRAETYDSNCKGIDVNRNFDIQFESLDDACDSTYSGGNAFDQEESKAIDSYLQKTCTGKKCAAFLSVHTFGRKVLYPWGFKDDDHAHTADEKVLSQEMASLAEAVDGVKWDHGIASTVGYRVTGCSVDYAQKLDIPISMAIELRGGQGNDERRGVRGFMPKASEIKPGGKQVSLMVSKMVEFTEKNGDNDDSLLTRARMSDSSKKFRASLMEAKEED